MRTTVSLVTALAVFLLFSCAEPKEEKQLTISVKEIPGTVRVQHPIKWEIGKPGGTWRDTYLEDPKSYNPFSNLDGTHLTVTRMILDYLFDYDPLARTWKGHLVKKFEVVFDEAKNSMELVCELRGDVFWSDGTQMSADDVVWWYDEIDGDQDIYPLGYQGQFVRMDDGTQKRITIQMLGKLKFKYVFPRIVANPVLMVNTGDIVPRHIWQPVKKQGKQAVADFWGIDTPPQKLVGNGPFLLEKNTPGERLTFARNPNYWQRDEKGNRLPYIERVVLTHIPDSNAELLRFQNGEIEAYALRGQDLATLLPKAQEKGYDIWNGGPADGYPALIFNQNPKAVSREKHALFTNRSFRQAVSCLVDRQTIIDQVINGLAEPLYHFVAESNRYYNPEYALPFRYNPRQAAGLLAEIGLKDTNGDGMLEDPRGKKLAFGIMTSSTDPILHDYLNMIITEMGKVGLKANLEVVDFNVVAQKILHTYDWDCYLASFSFPTFPEQWYNVWRSDGNLHYWYPKQEKPAFEWEAAVDRLYQKLIYTYGDPKIRELYNEFQKTILEEMQIVPIFRRYAFLAVHKQWGNVNWDTLHDLGDGLKRIYLRE